MSPPRVLVIACGALVREMRAVLGQIAGHVPGATIDIEYLPANLHNRPERIVDAVRAVVDAHGHTYDVISLGYADCGTGGGLDRYVEANGIRRLPGSHCYEFFAGADVFGELHDAEPGTFYLTDFLARHFDSLVISALGIDRHPELLSMYFGNYSRLCLLSQSDDPALVVAGQRAADQLGLSFLHMHTGLSTFGRSLTDIVDPRRPTPRTPATVGDPS
jgi:hypothetical protein